MGCAGSAGRARIAEVPDLCPGSITRVAVEGPEWRALLEQHLEGLRRELQGLQSQVQEQVQAQIQTGPRKCSATSGFYEEVQNERQLLWEESEILREELKLL